MERDFKNYSEKIKININANSYNKEVQPAEPETGGLKLYFFYRVVMYLFVFLFITFISTQTLLFKLFKYNPLLFIVIM